MSVDLTKRIHGLDALRGIAALIVVFNHFQVIFSPEFFNTFAIQYTPLRWLIDGRIAVILFFVLSGFVLSAPIVTGKQQPYWTFLTRRFTRIYLPFLFSILVAACLWWLVTSVHSNTQFAWNEWSHDLSISSFLSHIFATGLKGSGFLNPPVWTLVFELRVAILFPVLVWLVRRGPFLTLIGSVISAYVSSKIYADIYPSSEMYYSETALGGLLLTVYYIQFFVFGIFIATKIEWIKSIMNLFPERIHYALIALMFLVPAAIFDGKFILHEMWYAGMASYLIVCCIIYSAMNRELMSSPLQWLGKVSFSLYLLHMPVIFTMIYILLPYLPLWGILILSFPVVLVLAEFMHKYIEMPCMQLGKKWTNKRAVESK